MGNKILSIAVGCVRRLKHFHLGISSTLLLLRGPTKTTLSLYRIDFSLYRVDFRHVSKRLYMCIETTSICIETTGHREKDTYQTLLYSWHFSCYSAPIHWLVHGHMTSNNETVSRQMP